jgi:hypothetical protein
MIEFMMELQMVVILKVSTTNMPDGYRICQMGNCSLYMADFGRMMVLY